MNLLRIQEFLAIAIIILGFSLLLSVFLSSKRSASISRLTYLVVIISINFLNLLLIRYQIIPPAYNFFGVYAFMYGLLLREYYHQLENKSFTSRSRPITQIIFVAIIASYTILTASSKIKPTLFGFDDLETIPGILFMSISSVEGMLRFYRKRKDLPLVVLLFGSSCLLSLLVIFEFLLDFGQARTFYNIITSLIFLITYSLINTLIIHGLMASKSNQLVTPLKYVTSPLNEDNLLIIAERIKTHVIDNESYLNSNYSLDQLSSEVGISKPKISQALNEHFEKSFFEFVNELRIESAIDMMQSDLDAQLSIKEIMYSTGFTSKSTFNKYFKSATGYTPSAYQHLNRGNRFE